MNHYAPLTTMQQVFADGREGWTLQTARENDLIDAKFPTPIHL